MTIHFITSFVTLVGFGSIVAGEDIKIDSKPIERKESWPEKESFENGLPEYITSTDSQLSLTHDHVQDGSSALRWNFQNNATLSFKTGSLGDVNIYTGYGNYSRSSFTLRVYLPEISQSKMVVEFLSGDQVAGFYEVPFQHKGWQQIVHHYSWHSGIKWTKENLRKTLDHIRIRVVIPQKTKSAGYAVFDAIQYNTPRDFRDARKPVTQQWAPVSPDFSKDPQPSVVDFKNLSKLESLLSGKPNPKVKDEYWQKRLLGIQKRISDEGLSSGHPIQKNLGHYFKFLNQIAKDYNTCVNSELRMKFAKAFIDVNSWMQEQGLVVNGVAGKANNYIGRTYVDAISKMRDPLAKANELTTALNFIKWSYGYDRDFFPKKESSHVKSMDYFHNEALRLLRVALMHQDPITRWHHVARFRENLSAQLVASIKPDGSLFHHGMHYFAYGTMGVNSISGTLLVLTRANLPVSEPALDSVKLAAMQMRWYAGGKIVLLSLCGRHPSGKQNLPTEAFLNIAKAYAPYRDGKWDKELTDAYLRFNPKLAKQSQFANYVAEPPPQGFVTMPYAGLGLHRRSHWLAGVKGFSDFVASGESYANANRFGVYLSNGYLELLTHPTEMPTVHGSGIRPDQGMDWLALDGTTAIHSSLSKIANGNGSRHETGGGIFNGGLSHKGHNGMFVQVINSRMQANMAREKGVKGKAFTAKKSWFFFEDRIICLGSDISVDHVDFPVHTTLFQKFLTDVFSVTVVNKESLTLGEGNVEYDYKKNVTTLTDPYGNSYVTAKGTFVKLTIGKQKSRNGYDNKDTTGNYATAWIDHGTNPKSANYQYAILVQASPETVSQFTQAMEMTEVAPYLVIKQDKSAHIVYDRASKTTAYAIFDDQAILPSEVNSPLLNVAQPCLVMIEEKDGCYLVSLTNPSPRDHEKQALPISVTFKGVITLLTDLPQGSIHSAITNFNVKNPSPHTTIVIPITHGESITFKIKK